MHFKMSIFLINSIKQHKFTTGSDRFLTAQISESLSTIFTLVFFVLTGSRFGEDRDEASEHSAQHMSGDSAHYPAVAVQLRLRLVMDSHIVLYWVSLKSIPYSYIHKQHTETKLTQPI